MVAAHPCSLVHALPTNYPLTDYYPLASPDPLLLRPTTSTSSLAAPLAHAGCNNSHLAVGALGVLNGLEDRDLVGMNRYFFLIWSNFDRHISTRMTKCCSPQHPPHTVP